MERIATEPQADPFKVHFDYPNCNNLVEAEEEASLEQWPNDSHVGLNKDQFVDGRFNCSRDNEVYDDEECNALDLRVKKGLRSGEPFAERQNKRQPKTIAQLLENFYYNEACCENFYPGATQSGFLNRSACGEDYSESIIDYSTYSELTEEVNLNDRCKDAATNTDFNSLIDQETQTEKILAKDAASQCDIDPNVVCEAVNNLPTSNIRFSCSPCQKFDTTKGGDPHRQTDLKLEENQNSKSAIMNLKFLTQAKLQVYKRRFLKRITKQGHDPKSKLVQMPKSSSCLLKCTCCPFTSQLSLNFHKKNECLYDPFPMIKCNNCPLEFYTKACLEEHIGIAHNKRCAADCYYCVFCNDKFDDAENFHIHLDKHIHFSPLN